MRAQVSMAKPMTSRLAGEVRPSDRPRTRSPARPFEIVKHEVERDPAAARAIGIPATADGWEAAAARGAQHARCTDFAALHGVASKSIFGEVAHYMSQRSFDPARRAASISASPYCH